MIGSETNDRIKAGLIQLSLKADTSRPPNEIRDAMLVAHEPLIEDAARTGVQVLCMQEVFTQPYFPPSRDRKWYDAAEPIPDGPTVQDRVPGRGVRAASGSRCPAG